MIVLLELVISNTSLATNWNKYRKNLKAFGPTPECMDLNEQRFKALSGAIENITAKLMNDDIVQNSLQNILTLRRSLVDKNCTVISEEFTMYLRQAVINLDKLVQEKPNVLNMYKCIKINSLFVLSSHLFGNIDKKIFKSLMDLNTKVYIFYTHKID